MPFSGQNREKVLRFLVIAVSGQVLLSAGFTETVWVYINTRELYRTPLCRIGIPTESLSRLSGAPSFREVD